MPNHTAHLDTSNQKMRVQWRSELIEKCYKIVATTVMFLFSYSNKMPIKVVYLTWNKDIIQLCYGFTDLEVLFIAPDVVLL